jgi:3-oxoacyl-[acyl-carrier-protein] synthase II
MKRRVVVTGLGLITSLGQEVEPFWKRLLAGESGISRIQSFDTSAYSVQIAGEIKDFNPESYIDKREARHLDRFAQMGVAAAIQAVKDSGLDLATIEDPYRVGAIIGSGIGGLAEFEEQHTRLMEKGPMRVSPYMVPKLMINAVAGQVSILYHIKGPNAGVANACASANNAIGQAYWTIQIDEADVMISGGSEAALTPMGLAGFCTARALSMRNDDPAHASRPFDRGRDGFVLSEGAGIVVLEEYEHAKRRGARIYAEVVGFGMSGDGCHIVQPEPEGRGAAAAMRAMLADAEVAPDSVDYINAHGTSTPLGDIAETKAVKNQIAPPTINLEDPDPECDLDYVPLVARPMTIRRAASNSFGFGGHNASLLVQKV